MLGHCYGNQRAVRGRVVDVVSRKETCARKPFQESFLKHLQGGCMAGEDVAGVAFPLELGAKKFSNIFQEAMRKRCFCALVPQNDFSSQLCHFGKRKISYSAFF